MAPASRAEAEAGGGRLVRIFCDADVLIAGAASTRGASHILLQLSELTLVDCVSSSSAINEAERNIGAKLPAALPAFRKILDAAIDVVPEAASPLAGDLGKQAHPKDVPILAAAVASGADFLATFNVREIGVLASSPSQAGRRRFDPGRPLFVSVPLPASLSAIRSVSLRCPLHGGFRVGSGSPAGATREEVVGRAGNRRG